MWLITLLVFLMLALQEQFSSWPFSLVSDELIGWQRGIVRAFLYYAIWLLGASLLVASLSVGWRSAPMALGLTGSIRTALIVGLFGTAILPIGFAFTSVFDPPSAFFQETLRGSLLPGTMEEIFFRGMLFGLLFRFAGWGFLPAALIGAIIFGAAHLWQSQNAYQAAGIFLVTGIGAIWFSWLYVEWNYNIWVPATFHVLMNFYWSLFETGGNALGNISGIVLRLLVILISIGFTILYARKMGGRRIKGRDWLWRGKLAKSTHIVRAL